FVGALSVYEILGKKIEAAQTAEQQEKLKQQREKGRKATNRTEKSMFEKVMSNTTTRQIGRTVARELTRGLLGALGINTSSRRRSKKSGWF
ncbi:MAG: helicase HerA-like domain-containing protein, partial [Bacteroidota bacterium]